MADQSGQSRRGAPGRRPSKRGPTDPLPAPHGLPGEDLIRAGLEDLARSEESIPALLVSIGAPRLQRLGHAVANPIAGAEHRLYERLRAADPDTAHSRYNALIRRLVSYERAAECAS